MNSKDFVVNWEDEDESSFGDLSNGGVGAFWADETGSPIDELLASRSDPETIPLELFFQEPTLLQEITGHNIDLLCYLETKIDMLLDYALLGAPKGHRVQNERYSHIAFEILNANTNELSRCILSSKQHLHRLFQLVELPAPLPSARLAGNFHMLLVTLCTRDVISVLRFASKQAAHKKTVAELIYAFEHHQVSKPLAVDGEEQEEREPLVLCFIRHLDTTAITSAFICLAQAAFHVQEQMEDGDEIEQSSEDGGEEVDFSVWQGMHGTVQLLLSHLEKCPHNVSEVLVELYGLAAARAKEMKERDLVTSFAALIDEDSKPAVRMNDAKTGSGGKIWTVSLVSDLCETFLRTKDFSTRVALLTVLHEVVQVYSQPFASKQDFGSQELEALVKALPLLAEHFASAAAESKDDQSSRLGMDRLIFASLVCEFILCGHRSLVRDVPASCLELVLDWFFQYDQNNLLHCAVMRALQAILSGTKADEQQQQQRLNARSNNLFMDHNDTSAQEEAMQLERMETLRALEPLQEVLLCPSSSKCRLISRVLEHAKDFPRAATNNVVYEENYFAVDGNVQQQQQEDKRPVKEKKPQRVAFVGHLRVLANELSQLIESQMLNNDGYAFDVLSQMPEVAVEWHDFVAGPLEEMNQRVKRPLGSSTAGAAYGGGKPAARNRYPQPRATFSGIEQFTMSNDFVDDDDDDDSDEEEDSEEVMRRYYSRSKEEVVDFSNMVFSSEEEEDEATEPAATMSFWTQEDEDALAAEDEEASCKSSVAAATQSMPIATNTAASTKKRPQELLGVSPSWVTSFDNDDEA